MFKKTWLSAAALGCALTLAAPLTALAHDRDDYSYRDYGYGNYGYRDHDYRDHGYRDRRDRGYSSYGWNQNSRDNGGSYSNSYGSRGAYQGSGNQQFFGSQGSRGQNGNRVPTSPFDPSNNQPAPYQNQNQQGGASNGYSNRSGGSFQGGSNYGRR